MVYKIIGDFSEESFEELLNTITPFFNFIYKKNTMFIALRDYKNREKANTTLQSFSWSSNSLLCIEICEKNVIKENEEVCKWCTENLVRIEQQRFEIEQQEKLQNVMKAMDLMEKELDQELKQKLTEERSNKSTLKESAREEVEESG